MGGNALKGIVDTRRYSAAEYHATVPGVLARVRQVLGETGRVDVIPAYKTKPDYGDMDVLVEMPGGGQPKLRERLLEAFNARDLVANGSVYSIPHVDLQVDLIFSSPEKYDFSLNYFSYNDLGNLVGRTAHKQGLIFGHDGLRYPVRDGDYQFREIAITRDFNQALEFLGYDSKRFTAGFDTLVDIFQYVASSDYFARDIFLLENRNATSRVRDSKRKTYMEFLDWCESHPELPAFQYPKDKSVWLPRLMERFPSFGPELNKAYDDLATQRAVKAKFGGAYVRDVTGLVGQELGELMQGIRNSFADQAAMQSFVLSADESTLKARVLAIQKQLGDQTEVPRAETAPTRTMRHR